MKRQHTHLNTKTSCQRSQDQTRPDMVNRMRVREDRGQESCKNAAPEALRSWGGKLTVQKDLSARYSRWGKWHQLDARADKRKGKSRHFESLMRQDSRLYSSANRPTTNDSTQFLRNNRLREVGRLTQALTAALLRGLAFVLPTCWHQARCGGSGRAGQWAPPAPGAGNKDAHCLKII